MEQNAFDVLRERGFIYQCTAEDEVRELLGRENEGEPCRLKEGANWRREWELNPPEPVLQTVALAARPSRHC